MKYFLWVALIGMLANSAGAQSAVALNTAAFADLKVYPNPWRSDLNRQTSIKFTPLPDGASVEIFTISGVRVRTLEAQGSEALWDCQNDQGKSVASGIYLYLVKDPSGNKSTGKLAVIR